MGKDRIAYLDFVKFVAILLVCVGHCYVMTPNLDSIVRPIIYSFHMPLFMLVCGYFSSRSLDIPMKTLIMKKGKQLLIPVVCCTIITIILFGGVFREEIIGCVWF
ncbi:acyltransferase family protein [Prevotella veroralis]|nr:acyltransferase family protein [Prevotella veroralis]